MGRHTRLVTHIIPDTSSVLLDGKVKGSIQEILEQYSRIDAILIEQGKDIEVRCWEAVWTSGL